MLDSEHEVIWLKLLTLISDAAKQETYGYRVQEGR